jgi:hypothetical protein
MWNGQIRNNERRGRNLANLLLSMIFVGGLASACSTTVPPQSGPEMSADAPAWDTTGTVASNAADQDIVEYDPTDPWGRSLPKRRNGSMFPSPGSGP